MPVHECIVSGCFHTVRAELTSWARDHMVYKPKILSSLSLKILASPRLKGTTWEQSCFIRHTFFVSIKYFVALYFTNLTKATGIWRASVLCYTRAHTRMCVCLKMCTLSDYKFGYIQWLKYSDTQPEWFHGDSESSACFTNETNCSCHPLSLRLNY